MGRTHALPITRRAQIINRAIAIAIAIAAKRQYSRKTGGPGFPFNSRRQTTQSAASYNCTWASLLHLVVRMGTSRDFYLVISSSHTCRITLSFSTKSVCYHWAQSEW